MMQQNEISAELEDQLLKSPSKKDKADVGNNPAAPNSPAGRKAYRQYKAAIAIDSRLGPKNARDLTPEEADSLSWAKERLASSQKYFECRVSNDPRIPKNSKESRVIPASKRDRSLEEGSINQQPKREKLQRSQNASSTVRTTSDVVKNSLVVALVDFSNPQGQISKANWRTVEARLLEKLIDYMDANADKPMPTYDGAGWFNGVKIISCKDQFSLEWCTAAVKNITNVWEGAKLAIVDRSMIPTVPKAKVVFPVCLPQDKTMQLLKRQNPDIPTQDWSVLKAIPSTDSSKGPTLILQINKDSEDILYARRGKMAWGMASVYLRLKKRSPDDANDNTLETDEVEIDLGLESLAKAASSCRLVDEDVCIDVQNATSTPNSSSTDVLQATVVATANYAEGCANKPPAQ